MEIAIIAMSKVELVTNETMDNLFYKRHISGKIWVYVLRE